MLLLELLILFLMEKFDLKQQKLITELGFQRYFCAESLSWIKYVIKSI